MIIRRDIHLNRLKSRKYIGIIEVDYLSHLVQKNLSSRDFFIVNAYSVQNWDHIAGMKLA